MQSENLDIQYEDCVHCGDAVVYEDRTQWQKTIERELMLDTCHPCGERYYRNCIECNNTNDHRNMIDGYCDDCYHDIFGECNYCYGRYRRDDWDDNGRCESCNERYSDLVGRDGYDAPSAFRGEAKDGIYFGFEWEVEVNGSIDDGAYGVYDQLPEGYCILKEDSTIDHGFELCTQPATIAEHKKAWKAYWKNPCRYIEAEPHCGVHVHISRAPLSQLQIGKMIVFVHGAENEQFIEQRIAERHNRAYADFKKRRKITEATKDYGDRDAVNIDNRRTIELRIFKSTISELKFWKNLEFAEALVRFTHNSAHSIREMNWRVFQKFVKHNAKQWPNLHKVIADYNE